MNLLLLGRGKTGSLVAEVAAERKHHTRIVASAERQHRTATHSIRKSSADIDAVIDFTAPHCVLANIEACVKAGKNMVVGTTGWYKEMDRVAHLLKQHDTGFLYAANFSIGVNLFLEIDPNRRRRAALRLLRANFRTPPRSQEGRSSGTAIASSTCFVKPAGTHEDLEITSFREGEVVGLHEIVSNPKPTESISATTQSPAEALPKAPYGPPNGSPGKKASTNSKTSGASYSV